jgi:sugar fermentation stimulation protein A
MAPSIPLHLSRGELLRRPNRFVFEGLLDGRPLRLHCPVTGSIGGLRDFRGLPCLVAPGPAGDSARTTAGTVEALSLDGGGSWIGINQTRINGWVEQFLRADALPGLISCEGAEIRHEVRVGESRLDLCVVRGEERAYLELKTPIHDLFLGPGVEFSPPYSPDYFARGIRHFGTLARLAREGNRALVAICFMYNAVDFEPPAREDWNGKIRDAVARAHACGVENWQINFEISPTELRVTRLLRLSWGF